jgi:hypothetical protein
MQGGPPEWYHLPTSHGHLPSGSKVDRGADRQHGHLTSPFPFLESRGMR